jgi:hypothetical protein
MWQFLSQMRLLNTHTWPVLFHKRTSLPFSDSFTLNTITNALTQALQSVNKWKNIQYSQLKFFQCSQHKQILFLNSLVFPLFRPLPVYECIIMYLCYWLSFFFVPDTSQNVFLYLFVYCTIPSLPSQHLIVTASPPSISVSSSMPLSIPAYLSERTSE